MIRSGAEGSIMRLLGLLDVDYTAERLLKYELRILSTGNKGGSIAEAFDAPIRTSLSCWALTFYMLSYTRIQCHM